MQGDRDELVRVVTVTGRHPVWCVECAIPTMCTLVHAVEQLVRLWAEGAEDVKAERCKIIVANSFSQILVGTGAFFGLCDISTIYKI